VAARAPIVAFNVELAAPANLERAKRIARAIREPGRLAAIGVALASREHTAQVSMNVEDPFALPLAEVVERIAAQARIAAAEIVGLVPRAALAAFPDDVELRGFDPARQVAENALGFN
jgi:glutamate formiminotransferase/glutamate formiminotransferase/formiminotetrahydrofolate cyclodeaminase